MLQKEISIEMRGISRKEIEQYFQSICSYVIEDGKFGDDGWEVEVGEEYYVAFSSLKLSSVKIKFEGEENVLKKVIASFNLKFLRGGG